MKAKAILTKKNLDYATLLNECIIERRKIDGWHTLVRWKIVSLRDYEFLRRKLEEKLIIE